LTISGFLLTSRAFLFMPDVEIGSVGSVDMLPDPLVKSVDLTPQTPPQTPNSYSYRYLFYGIIIYSISPFPWQVLFSQIKLCTLAGTVSLFSRDCAKNIVVLDKDTSCRGWCTRRHMDTAEFRKAKAKTTQKEIRATASQRGSIRVYSGVGHKWTRCGFCPGRID